MISAIIPAYNAAKYLDETIQSVINQSYEDWELIIVNDGSTDGTRPIAENWTEKDNRIQLINKPNGGVSSARNIGILKAKGEFLAFLDADDMWESTFLADGFFELDQNPQFGLVHSDLAVINEKGQPTGEIKSGKSGALLDKLLSWKEHVMSPPSGILVRKSVVQEIGPFDEKISNNADQDFYIRVAARYPIGRIPKPLLLYRIHDQNMHSNIKMLEYDSLYVFNKAAHNKLFKSWIFKKKCFSNMYLILAINYLRHQNTKVKFIKYVMKSLITYPPALLWIIKKI